MGRRWEWVLGMGWETGWGRVLGMEWECVDYTHTVEERVMATPSQCER